MKKSVRKILSLVLTLVLICTLATVAFATYYAEDFVSRPFDIITLTAGVGIAEYSTEAYVNIGAANSADLRYATVEADVNLRYTYCPESAMRPSNYMTSSISRTLYKMDNSTTHHLVLSTGELQYGIYGECLVLASTGSFVINYTTPHSSGEYAPDPITVTFDY